MGTQENKDFVRRYLEALSGKPKPQAVVDKYVAEQPLKDHIAMYEAAFPKYEMEIERMIADGDLVSVIIRARGTQKEPFMGMPSAGKTFNVPLHITYRIADGKIVDHWLATDTFTFMQQLGFIPSPEGAD